MTCTTEKKHINLSHLAEVKKLLRSSGLNTVCESAKCPNIGECFHKRTAAFLILGNICTRNCSFCAVAKGIPLAPNPLEPVNVASAVKKLCLKYTVITSVTRDDLKDGGAAHFAKTVMAVKHKNEGIKIEVLTPDFKGDMDSARAVFESRPFVFNHNLETVKSLYSELRQMADYERSLTLLSAAKDFGLTVKSGIMLGAGETENEVIDLMKDLFASGCDIMTIGQYLAPSAGHYPVKEYISQQRFDQYRDTALSLGFKTVFSGPYVRSSYMAESIIDCHSELNVRDL